MADYHKRVVTEIEDTTPDRSHALRALRHDRHTRLPHSQPSCLPNLHDPGPAICGMPCLT